MDQVCGCCLADPGAWQEPSHQKAPDHARTSIRQYLVAGAPAGPLGSGGRPAKARAQLLDHDLNGGSGAAVLRRPGALLEPAHHHDPATLRQGLGRMLGLEEE